MRSALVEAIKVLPEREQYVMSMYYEHDMNLKEIAAVLKVTESRVCQTAASRRSPACGSKAARLPGPGRRPPSRPPSILSAAKDLASAMRSLRCAQDDRPWRGRSSRCWPGAARWAAFSRAALAGHAARRRSRPCAHRCVGTAFALSATTRMATRLRRRRLSRFRLRSDQVLPSHAPPGAWLAPLAALALPLSGRSALARRAALSHAQGRVARPGGAGVAARPTGAFSTPAAASKRYAADRAAPRGSPRATLSGIEWSAPLRLAPAALRCRSATVRRRRHVDRRRGRAFDLVYVFQRPGETERVIAKASARAAARRLAGEAWSSRSAPAARPGPSSAATAGRSGSTG